METKRAGGGRPRRVFGVRSRNICLASTQGPDHWSLAVRTLRATSVRVVIHETYAFSRSRMMIMLCRPREARGPEGCTGDNVSDLLYAGEMGATYTTDTTVCSVHPSPLCGRV